MFIPQNFETMIPLHKEFHQHRKNQYKKQQMISKATKFAAAAMTVAIFVVAVKYNVKGKGIAG